MDDAANQTKQAHEAVVRWAKEQFGWGPQQASIDHVAALSTPHFAFFIVAQRSMSAAGELYVMSDGQEVLPSSSASLQQVLQQESFPQHLDAIPAEQLAELFFKFVEVRQVHLITGTQDQALKTLNQQAQKEFTPPTLRREGMGAVATFWTSAQHPSQIEFWTLHIAADGSIKHEVKR